MKVHIKAEQNILQGNLLLTPIQKRFFEQGFSCPHYWNQSMLLQINPDITADILNKIIKELLCHHDTLRLRFKKISSGWKQYYGSPEDPIPVSVKDLRLTPDKDIAKKIETISSKAQASLNLTKGPIFKVVLFYLGPKRPSRLLWVIHHLAIDTVSWRILLEDFKVAYEQIKEGKEIKLPPKTTSYQYWAKKLTEYAQSEELKKELSYWCSKKERSVLPIPVDYSSSKEDNLEETVKIVTISLSLEETESLLKDSPKAYNTQINDLLLAALLIAYCKWSGQSQLLIDLEGHGREELFEDVDITRTVGWFTSIFPVYLEKTETEDISSPIKNTKEILRNIPQRGIGYGILKHLCKDNDIQAQLRKLPQADISFNYLGQFDQTFDSSSPFQVAKESSGSSQNLQEKRTHLLDIGGKVINSQLSIKFYYSSKVHKSDSIEKLASFYLDELKNIIAHCLSPEAGGFTPSDFEGAEGLSREKLDNLIDKLEERQNT